MPGMTELLTWLSLIAGAIGLQQIVLWFLNKRQGSATTRLTNAQATQMEVETMRGIVSEVRASDEAKSRQIERLEERMASLELHLRNIQVGLIPLNAWALAAHQVILPHNPDFPAPPIMDATTVPSSGRVIAEIVTKESPL